MYSVDWDGENAVQDYKIIFERHMFPAESSALMMIPMEFYNDAIMTTRYDLLGESFCLWANTKVRVRAKWYQTGLFKFVVTTTMMLVGAYTGQPWMVAMAAVSGPAMTYISKVTGPEIATALMIAYTTYQYSRGDFSAASSAVTVANISNQAYNGFYVQPKSERIAQNIESTNEDIEEANKLIEDMNETLLYIPLESQDRMNYMAYDMVYDSYSQMYDTIGSYENMYSLTSSASFAPRNADPAVSIFS